MVEGSLLEEIEYRYSLPDPWKRRLFVALSKVLDEHLEELTTRVIREAIDDDVSEAAEQPPKALPGPSGE